MSDEKPGLLDWLGLKTRPDYSRARWLGGLISVTVGAILLVLFIGTLAEFLKAIWRDDPDGTALRNTGLVLAAMIGVPFVVWRSVVAQKQVDVAEQGQITDRINKAVEGLGADKEESRLMRPVSYQDGDRTLTDLEGRDDPLVLQEGANPQYGDWTVVKRTKPNLEVRIGSIYALERIAQDSDRDHVQIVEILCAYIRQNAPASQAMPFPKDWAEAFAADWDAPDVKRPDRADIQKWARALEKPREDIQVALTVLGRRSQEQIKSEIGKSKDGNRDYTLDLHGTCLQGADIVSKQFDHARFDGAHMQGANLDRAQLCRAQFVESQMQGASLCEAKMQWVRLRFTQMQGALLVDTQMQRAICDGAEMQEASLVEAQTQGATFVGTQMQGALLKRAQMQGTEIHGAQMDATTILTDADLEGATVSNVDYSTVALSQAQVDQMFGDGSVTLPAGVSRPSHWLDHVADWSEFESAWRAWQKKTGFDPDDPAFR